MNTQDSRAQFEDGAWYWVELIGGYQHRGDPPITAPAMYKASSDAWRSAEFAGVSTRYLKVLEPCSRAALPAEPVPTVGFDLWWVDHMPSATQAEARAEWVKLHALPVARTSLSDGGTSAEQEKLIAAKDELYKSRIGLLCSHCKTGKYRASSNGYNDFHRCDSCRYVPIWGGDGKEWGITQEKKG